MAHRPVEAVADVSGAAIGGEVGLGGGRGRRGGDQHAGGRADQYGGGGEQCGVGGEAARHASSDIGPDPTGRSRSSPRSLRYSVVAFPVSPAATSVASARRSGT